MSVPNEWEIRFATYLKELQSREERATLAALRRGLQSEAIDGLLRYLPPWLMLRLGEESRKEEERYCVVAALFAWHPQTWEDAGRATSIGASLARLAAQERQATGEAKAPPAIERRFDALLQAHTDDLPQHLRQIIGLLRAKEIPVDWAQLLADMRLWGAESRSVQRAWARDFWRGVHHEFGEKGA